jgi:hypothetical protein
VEEGVTVGGTGVVSTICNYPLLPSPPNHRHYKPSIKTGAAVVGADTIQTRSNRLGQGQDKIFNQWDIPVQNIQSAGLVQYKLFSQQGYSSTKYSVSRISPVQNIQSVGIFQYKLFNQQGCSSTKYSVSRMIPGQNIQSVGVCVVYAFVLACACACARVCVGIME